MEDLAWVSELEGIGGYENSTPSALDKLMDDEVKEIFYLNKTVEREGKIIVSQKTKVKFVLGSDIEMKVIVKLENQTLSWCNSNMEI